MSFFFSASNLPFWAPPSPVLRARVGWWWWGLLRTLPPGPAPAGVSPASPSDPRGSLRAAAGTKSPPSLRNFGVWTASCLAKAPHRLPYPTPVRSPRGGGLSPGPPSSWGRSIICTSTTMFYSYKKHLVLYLFISSTLPVTHTISSFCLGRDCN